MAQASGALFFGGLCVGTFCLGVWQSQRYFEKVKLIEEQSKVLASESDSGRFEKEEFLDLPGLCHRVELRGQFRHRDEIIVGPRGPPVGALAKYGPKSGRSGGISSSPQGYFVLTPFLVEEDGREVLVNRGWDDMKHKDDGWDRPAGETSVVTVTSAAEKGGFFAPPPVREISWARRGNFRKQVNLLWLSEEALRDATNLRSPAFELYREVHGGESREAAVNGRPLVKPSLAQAIEFKVSPQTHAGYAATWFSLSGAGIFMTRKLLRAAK